MTKFTSLSIGMFMLVGFIAPAVASAQIAGNGLLSVYVQVQNSTTLGQRAPSDFQVLVAGQNASPSTFAGSLTGTQVSLGPGAYSVAISGNQWGYTPNYSQGCTGTIAAGQAALCIITMVWQYQNYPYPIAYPYPYNIPSLSCVAAQSTVGLLQSMSFSARGGIGGTYNWRAGDRNFPNAGPVLTVSFESSGSQVVTVTNGPQTATCLVEVTNSYFPTVSVPSTIYPNYSGYSNYPTSVLYTSYPTRLPNTGVEPVSMLQLALALALLAGLALVAQPYVRKAFVIATQ